MSKLLRSENAAAREAAWDIIHAIGSERALALLIEDAAPRRADGTIDAGATSAYGTTALDKKTVESLEGRYRAEISFIGRARILEVAIRARHPSALPVLMLGFDDPNPRLAGGAEAALGYLGAPNACRLLVPRLGDEQLARRLGAIEGLRALGDRGAIPHLVALVRGTPNVPFQPHEGPIWFPMVLHSLHAVVSHAVHSLTGDPMNYTGELGADIDSWIARHRLPGSSCPLPP